MATDDSEVVGATFHRAAEWMRNNKSLKLSNEQKLNLYGLFKQGVEGPCMTSKPGIFDMTGRAKWEAWHRLGDMSSHQAMVKYTNLVKTYDPLWEEHSSETIGDANVGKKSGGGGGGPVISTLMNNTSDVILEKDKTIFDWCKEGNVEKLESTVTETNVNSLDDQGMSVLHWACDRGHLTVAKSLIATGAEVNLQDSDLQTPLHYAASCSHTDVVQFLLSQPSINASLKDCDGATPAEVTTDPQIKHLIDQST